MLVEDGWAPTRFAKRTEEMQWLKQVGVYEKVSLDVPKAEGKTLLTLKLVDTHKCAEEEQEYQSRIVARGIKARGAVLPAAQLFSAMPPLERLKVLLSALVTPRQSNNQQPLKLGCLGRVTCALLR
jgi:hypothetical protein